MIIFLKAWVRPFSYLNAKGVRVEVPGYHRKNKVPSTSRLFDDWVVQEYKSGRSCPEIAAEAGRSVSKIWSIVRDAGCVRPHGEAMALRLVKYPNLSEHRGKQLAFHSKKNNEWLPASSRYEYVRMAQLEDDPDVLSFGRCTDRIPYIYDDTKRYYIPDLTVKRRSGISVEEIKPKAYVNDGKVAAKISAARAYYAGSGVRYEVVTEDQIGSDNVRRFDWTGLADIPNQERVQKERKRQREAKKREYAALSSEQRAAKLEKMKEYHADRIARMSEAERDELRKKNAEAKRRSRARLLIVKKETQ